MSGDQEPELYKLHKLYKLYKLHKLYKLYFCAAHAITCIAEDDSVCRSRDLVSQKMIQCAAHAISTRAIIAILYIIAIFAWLLSQL